MKYRKLVKMEVITQYVGKKTLSCKSAIHIIYGSCFQWAAVVVVIESLSIECCMFLYIYIFYRDDLIWMNNVNIWYFCINKKKQEHTNE